VTWNVALSTTGNDVSWASPTSVTPGFPEYDWSYEITQAMAFLSPFGSRDLLGDLAATSGSGTSAQLPLVLFESSLNDATTGSTADIAIGVDSAGVGRASGTNIRLGSFSFFQIRQVDLKATIRIMGIPTGDYDRNGLVAAADLQLWKNSFGSRSNLAADGNHNGVVDAADYTLWRNNVSAGGGAFADATAVPEPSAAILFVASLPWLGMRGRRGS
jgi:hypothetical protein